MEKIGFTLVHETEKAILWGCPFGQFWRPKKPFRTYQRATIENVKNVASEVAEEINEAWVVVTLLERTEGGGARITFAAERVLEEQIIEDNSDTGPLRKRSSLTVPSRWLVEVQSGQWVVQARDLSKKMAEIRDRASRRRRGHLWKPITGGVTTAEIVLNWLTEVNAAELSVMADAAAAASLQQKELEEKLAEEMRIREEQRPAREAEAAAAEQQEKQRLAAAEKRKADRIPDHLEECATVEWVEWGGTANKRIKYEFSEENCLVKYFGAKREITLPSGQTIVKMKGPNLKIYTKDSLT